MAQTDARPGFRLPWSSDRQTSDPSESETGSEPQPDNATAWPNETSGSSPEVAVATADTTVEPSSPVVDPWVGSAPTPEAPKAPSGKKPSKFLADLTKAMQTAAEDARSRAVSQLQAEAKTHVEAIHGRSSTEAASLRRAADDDVATVREWSKAEIARVREETETKITARKSKLEREIEEHAGFIEREIDAVQKTVASFEAEMAAFFERLLAEEDPSRFATMAENLPEPPSFEDIVASDGAVESQAVETETVDAVTEPVEASVADAQTEAEATTETETEDTVVAEAAATGAVDSTDGEATHHSHESGETDGSGDGEIDREAAFAAIQAAAEAAASAEVAADAAARAEAVADVAIEIIGNHEDEGEDDPRFAALGLSPDYDAAEAEALAAASSSDEDVPEIADDALAARLAGLVPGKGKGDPADSASTQLVVVGLVSVASIASFKRHLGRLPGVQSVGVSSGPDGEFIFAVNHGGDVVLRDAIPSLPSFQARVTGSSDGVVQITAHDPEADA